MMDKRELRLYTTMLKIGFIGFGGGSALVPVIEKEVVDEQKLISKDEYDKDVVVASITPGALPMEIATGIGKRCYGTRGMFGTAILMSMPGAFLTLLLLTVLNSVEGAVLKQISFLSIGITAFISCMLTGYIVSTIKGAREASRRRELFTLVIIIGVIVLTLEKNLYRLLGISMTPIFGLSTVEVLAMAFFVVFYTRGAFTKVNVVVTACALLVFTACEGQRQFISSPYVEIGVKLLMVVLSVWGFVGSLSKQKKNTVSVKVLGREVILWLLFAIVCSVPAVLVTVDSLTFFFRGVFSSLISFGGGDAYLIVADGLFVNTGMISEEFFYGKLVTIVNLLPGSILCKTMTGVGYDIGYELERSNFQGILVALLGYASSVMASGGVFCVGDYIFQKFKSLNVFHLITRMIKPIISGLLISVMLSLVLQNTAIGRDAAFGPWLAVAIMGVVYVLDLYLSRGKKCSNALLVALSAVISIVICNVLQILM